jgi:nicotinamide-nucleotide amidase
LTADALLEGAELALRLGDALVRADATLALAESCTGGLVSEWITDVPGSSRYFRGAVVAYADDAKVRLLGVAPATLREHGAVSEQVAAEMAHGAAASFGASIGLAITGIAGPEGAVPGKPVGTVYLALKTRDRLVARRAHYPGNRAAVRTAAASEALRMALGAVSP